MNRAIEQLTPGKSMPSPSDAVRLLTSDFRLRRQQRRGGFSFIEVLFAVMILGIGFIMIAGVFPVAISQTAQTQEETIAAACSRGGVAAITSIRNLSGVIPNNGQVVRLTDSVWDLIKANQILPQDRRYAWIPLIKRDAQDYRGQPPTIAQLIIVPVQVRGRANFDNTDLAQSGSGASAYSNLMPWSVKVTLTEGKTSPDIIDIAGDWPGVAAPGAVIVIASGNDSAGRPAAGRIYRLGNRPDDNLPNRYELLRGSDMTIDPGPNNKMESPIPGTGDDITQDTGSLDAWVIGQGMGSPGVTASIGNGSMATGVYTTYIELKQ